MKCLPASKVPMANGIGLHDWHAEILAVRGFNHFVLQECRSMELHEVSSSEFLRRRGPDETATTDGDATWHAQPFAWRDGVTLHMYCSEAPCKKKSPLAN